MATAIDHYRVTTNFLDQDSVFQCAQMSNRHLTIDPISNVINDHFCRELLLIIGLFDISEFMKARRIQWLSHILRIRDSRTPKRTPLTRMFQMRRKGQPNRR